MLECSLQLKNMWQNHYHEQKKINFTTTIANNLIEISAQDNDLAFFLRCIKLSDKKLHLKSKITTPRISPIFVIGNHFII